jgi:hypothetical protein
MGNKSGFCRRYPKLALAALFVCMAATSLLSSERKITLTAVGVVAIDQEKE